MVAKVSVAVLGITEFDDQELVNTKLNKVLTQLGSTVKEVITTDDRGVTAAARTYCEVNDVKCKILSIDWNGEGPAARPICNEKAISDARVVIIIWDDKCPHVAKLVNRAMALRRRLILVKTNVSKVAKVVKPAQGK